MQGLLSHEYDGNGWWAGMALLGAFILSKAVSHLRDQLRKSQMIEVKKAVGVILLISAMIALSIYQIATHSWK